MTSSLFISSYYFQLNCFAILLIDDYRNVHAKKVPTKLITSTATQMDSCLLDIHPTIPAVPYPQQTPLHRPVRITIKGTQVTKDKNNISNGLTFETGIEYNQCECQTRQTNTRELPQMLFSEQGPSPSKYKYKRFVDESKL